MSETTNLEIVTPSMVIISEPVEMVVVPGADGQIGALPSSQQRRLTRKSSLLGRVHPDALPSFLLPRPKARRLRHRRTQVRSEVETPGDNHE